MHVAATVKDCITLSSIEPGRVLGRLIPEVKSNGYNLRPWAHLFVLPPK